MLIDSELSRTIFKSLSHQLLKKRAKMFMANGYELLEWYSADRAFYVVVDYPDPEKPSAMNCRFRLVESVPLVVSMTGDSLLRSEYLSAIAPSLKPSEYVIACNEICRKGRGEICYEPPIPGSSIYPAEESGYNSLDSIAGLIAEFIEKDEWLYVNENANH